MILTNNFNLDEFLHEGVVCVPVDVMDNLQRLAWNLQSLRDYLDEPIHINSGYRTPEHNKAVGGVEYSQHLYGKAADIWVKGMTPLAIKETIEFLIKREGMDEGGIGLYDTFVHYDCRLGKVRWDYRKNK